MQKLPLRTLILTLTALWKETTMSLKWIAVRLQMGSWSYVFNLLAAYRDRKQR